MVRQGASHLLHVMLLQLYPQQKEKMKKKNRERTLLCLSLNTMHKEKLSTFCLVLQCELNYADLKMQR